MKYGPKRTYRNAFVVDCSICVAGLPDVPESQPPSQVNGWRFWR